MAEQPARLGRRIDLHDIDIVSVLDQALDKGCAVLGETIWHNGREQRIAGLLKRPLFSDMTPRVGYGRGNTIDQALLRCVYTYLMVKPREFVDPDEYLESSYSPLSITGAPTQLDATVGRGDLRIHKDENVTIASSLYGYEASEDIMIGEGAGVREAISDLTGNYPFLQRSIKKLPVTLLWDAK